MAQRVKRRPDWQARLKECTRAYLRQPFQYGKADGALFAAAALDAMTGVDVARGLRGYRTLAGGMKKLRAKGFEKPADPFAAVLVPIPALHAQPGDLMLFGDICLGVCIGADAYAMDEDEGLGRTPITQATGALRVPD